MREACETYRPHINDPCMICGESALRHKKRKDEDTNKGEVQVAFRYIYLLDLLDRLKEETRHISPTSGIHIHFEDGEWRALLTFKDRRRNG